MKKINKICLTIILLFSVIMLCSCTNNSVDNSSNINKKALNNSVTDPWELVLQNLDIEIKYLEPNKHLGLYWDSYANGNSKDGFLYLIWVSEYYSTNNLTVLQFTESNSIYTLYSTPENASNNKGKWLPSIHKDYPSYNLSLHMTPIGGIKDGQNFGVKLKRTYNFTNVKFGQEKSLKGIGQLGQVISYDLGKVPVNDGKNAMQLCTHGYEIIKECEAQSYFDAFAYGGYGHFAYFNTTIKIDKIYRVDVSYKVVNDDKPWYQFWLPSDEHQMTKSLTPERIKGGIFGLYDFYGFKEGSFQPTKNSSINYKYKLHLNCDDKAWSIYQGKGFYEADYRRISKFQILRLNYVVDGETFDVPVKMDTIEGDTLFILDPDLILNTETPYFNIKNAIDDFLLNFKENFAKFQNIALIILGCVGSVFLVMFVSKTSRLISSFINYKSENDNNENNK